MYFDCKCPLCDGTFEIRPPGQNEVKCELEPVGNIRVFKINSEQVQAFLLDKVRLLTEKNTTKLEVVTQFGKKANNRSDESKIKQRLFTSLKIALSEDVVEGSGTDDYYRKLGQNEMNIEFINPVFKGFIQKFGYNRKALEEELSYKDMERIENNLRITEWDIERIKEFIVPKRIVIDSKERWIFFSARTIKVLEDMLTEPGADELNGTIEIAEAYPISNSSVTWVVYLHPLKTEASENPLVRKLLMGQRK